MSCEYVHKLVCVSVSVWVCVITEVKVKANNNAVWQPAPLLRYAQILADMYICLYVYGAIVCVCVACMCM